MSVAASPQSSLPAEHLATSTHDALSRHVFPPFFPSPADYKAIKDGEKKASSREASSNQPLCRSVRIASQQESEPPSTSLSMGSSSLTMCKSASRAPTGQTLKYFSKGQSFE